jgi:hypothetical protein
LLGRDPRRLPASNHTQAVRQRTETPGSGLTTRELKIAFTAESEGPTSPGAGGSAGSRGLVIGACFSAIGLRDGKQINGSAEGKKTRFIRKATPALARRTRGLFETIFSGQNAIRAAPDGLQVFAALIAIRFSRREHFDRFAMTDEIVAHLTRITFRHLTGEGHPVQCAIPLAIVTDPVRREAATAFLAGHFGLRVDGDS